MIELLIAGAIGGALGIGGIVGVQRYEKTKQANKYRIALRALSGTVDKTPAEQIASQAALDANLLEQIAKAVDALRKPS